MAGYVFDTETHDLTNPRVIQACYMPVCIIPGFCLPAGAASTEFFNPCAPITAGAMATHHLIDEDVLEAKLYTEFKLPSDCEYLIGHNISFDLEVALNSGPQPEVKLIDTLFIAKRLWPDLHTHTLTALSYHFADNKKRARDMIKNAHDAEVDVTLCVNLLSTILSENSDLVDMESLYEFSEFCRIPVKMEFGKHKGVFIRDLPADYLRWFVKQKDVDAQLMKALSEALAAHAQ